MRADLGQYFPDAGHASKVDRMHEICSTKHADWII